MELISSLALRSRQRRANERQGTRDSQRYRNEPHPSHSKAQNGVFQQTGGRVLTPSEIIPYEDPPNLPQQAPAPSQAPSQASHQQQHLQQQQQQHRSSVTLGPGHSNSIAPPPAPAPAPPPAPAPAPAPSSLPPLGGGQDQGQPSTGGEGNPSAPSTHPQAPQPPPLPSSSQPVPSAAASAAPQGGDLPSSLPPLPPGMSMQQMQLFMSKMQQMNPGGAL